MRLYRLAALGILLATSHVHAGAPRGLPVCQAGDGRVPVHVWTPDFRSDGNLTSAPDAEAGDVYFIEFYRENADYGCASSPEDKLYSLSYPDPGGGGLAVNLRGNVQFANGYCYVSGFFLNHQVMGMHQGWIETYFDPLALRDVMTSPRYCRKDSAAEAVQAKRAPPAGPDKSAVSAFAEGLTKDEAAQVCALAIRANKHQRTALEVWQAAVDVQTS